MYIEKHGCRLVFIALVLIAFSPPVLAQYESDFKNENRMDLKDIDKRKAPSFFRRPAKETPAAQLEFANKLLADGKKAAARKQFSALVHKWHTSPEAPAAQLAYARILYEMNDYSDAFDEFQYLIDNFAGQFPYEEALDKQFRIANYLMTARRMKFFFMPGFAIQEQALPLFEKIVKNAPSWKGSVEAQFNVGLINEQMGNYQAAVKAYETCRYRYPDSERAADSAFHRARCLYLMANESPRDETLCRQALSAVAGFIADYSKHGSIEVAREYRDALDDRLTNMYYELAVFYDKTGKSKAAIIAYEDFIRKFPSSKLVGAVSVRIETLKGKQETGK